MAITVRDALGLFPFSEGRLLAGAGGIDRIVSSVNVMDAPDIVDWVKPGELLLTTAYAMQDHLNDIDRLIGGLADKGCTGLSIKVGRFLSSVPSEMIEVADRRDFPLVALPLQYTLSDQMNVLYATLVNQNHSRLREIFRQQEHVLQLMTETQRPLPEWFSDLCARIGRPAEFVAYSREFSQIVSGQRDVGHPGHGVGDGARYWQCEVQHQGRFFGWLRWWEEKQPFLPEEETLFRQAAGLLALRISRHEDHMAEVFAGGLKAGLEGSVLAERLAQSGWQFPKAYRCLVSGMGARDSGAAVVELSSYLRRHPLLANYGASHFLAKDRVVSVMAVSSDPLVADDLVSVLKDIHFDLTRQTEEVIHMALSDIHEGPREWSMAYRDASFLFDEQLRQDAKGGVYQKPRYDMGQLLEGIPEAKLEGFVRQTLGPLLAKDDYYRELLWTLRVFLDSEGQIAEAAKRLYVHRNTMTYRLERIEELLHCDLKRLDTLLALRVALRYHGAYAPGDNPGTA